MDAPTTQELSLEDLAEAIGSVTGRPPGSLAGTDVEFSALGVTSLHFFRLIAVLEERTSITFEDEYLEPEQLRRVSDLRRVLGSYGVALQNPIS
jgi:acyl carrier protein